METLPDRLDQVARTLVSNDGTLVQGRRGVNFKPGTSIAYTIEDNSTTENVDVTIGTTGLVIGVDVAAYDATQVLPAGMLVPYAGSTAPTGWLFCFGQSLLRADYDALFTAISTTYGAADGTHFNCPDLRGRTVLTLDDMGGSDAGNLTMANTLGLTGGEEKHTLLTAELASHTHTQDAHTHTQNTHTHTQDTHNHTYINMLASGGGYFAPATTSPGYFTTDGTGNTVATNQNTVATNQNTTATNQNTGSGTAHNVLQPYILLNHIIKT